MIRRRTVIPLLAWLGKHTTEDSRLDRWVHRALGRSIGRLSESQLHELIQRPSPKITPADRGRGTT